MPVCPESTGSGLTGLTVNQVAATLVKSAQQIDGRILHVFLVLPKTTECEAQRQWRDSAVLILNSINTNWDPEWISLYRNVDVWLP